MSGDEQQELAFLVEALHETAGQWALLYAQPGPVRPIDVVREMARRNPIARVMLEQAVRLARPARRAA